MFIHAFLTHNLLSIILYSQTLSWLAPHDNWNLSGQIWLGQMKWKILISRFELEQLIDSANKSN